MILLLPLWEATPQTPPLAMQFIHGRPTVWWALQSYEKLANLVIGVVTPAHLQAGIQVHLPKSTGLLIASQSMPDLFTMCLEAKSLLTSEEELLVADPLIAFDPFQMKQALYTFRASTASWGIISESHTTWWRHAKTFLDSPPQIGDFLPTTAVELSVPLRNFEENLPGQGQWLSQGEWR